MDRNSIIGLVLIGLIIIGYSIYTQPGPEEIQAMKARTDSIVRVEEQKRLLIAQEQAIARSRDSSDRVLPDSVVAEMEKQRLGDFSSAATGNEQLITLENKNLRVVLTSKGGRIKSAELKNYKSWDKKPLYL